MNDQPDELSARVDKPQSPWIVTGVGAVVTVLGAPGLGAGGVGAVLSIVVFVVGTAIMSMGIIGLGIRFGGQWVDYDRDRRRMTAAAAEHLRITMTDE